MGVIYYSIWPAYPCDELSLKLVKGTPAGTRLASIQSRIWVRMRVPLHCPWAARVAFDIFTLQQLIRRRRQYEMFMWRETSTACVHLIWNVSYDLFRTLDNQTLTFSLVWHVENNLRYVNLIWEFDVLFTFRMTRDKKCVIHVMCRQKGSMTVANNVVARVTCRPCYVRNRNISRHRSHKENVKNKSSGGPMML